MGNKDTSVPLFDAVLSVQATQFTSPARFGVVGLLAGVPVLTHPAITAGGPWPESAVVNPLTKSYVRALGSIISYRLAI